MQSSLSEWDSLWWEIRAMSILSTKNHFYYISLRASLGEELNTSVGITSLLFQYHPDFNQSFIIIGHSQLSISGLDSTSHEREIFFKKLHMCWRYTDFLSLFPKQYKITSVCIEFHCIGITSNLKMSWVYRRMYICFMQIPCHCI